ncbi:hypothetical protein N8456_02135 [Porticoccaceae bacterium]|nr:hypothetical protein [Porticoccaceae bacterium]
MVEVPKDKLWNDIEDGATYPPNEKWHSHLLEQYKLYVEMADRISQRRTSANTYFLSVNSAILAFVGYLTSESTPDYMWLLALAGYLLTIFWYNIVLSYKNLNTEKWQVVHDIEKRLPISPYDAEWDAVQRGCNPKLYRPITHIESWVPWIFSSYT